MTLAPLEIKIQRALDMPNGSVRVQRVGVARRPLITLVDAAFEEKSDLERQRDVRRRLREADIDPNDLGFIMTYTPEEDEALREDFDEEPAGGTAEAR